MTYASNLGAITPMQTVLGPANSDFMLTGVEPLPLLAGPGKQRVVLHGSGFNGHQRLSVGAWSSVTEDSTGDTLENISSDGTRGEVTLDFKGVAGAWQIQLFDPYKPGNLESNPLVVQVVPGTPTAYDPYAFSTMLMNGQVNPYVVQAVLAFDAHGNVVVTGGVAYPPSADGSVHRVDTTGPGLLYNRPGGTWQFVPVQQFGDADRQAAADAYQVPNTATAWAGRGGLDPFGIPLPGTIGRGDGQVPWLWPDGSPVVSPWASVYVAATGSVGGGSVGGEHADDPTDATALVPSATDPSGSALPSAAPVPPPPFTSLQQVVPVSPSSVSPAVLLLAAGVLAYLASGKRGN